MGIWGPSIAPISPSPASYLIGSPPPVSPTKDDNEEKSPLVDWCRNTMGTLKREREPITTEMQRAINLYRGGTPWWKSRPRWKMGTRMNECMYVPTQWAAILSDNKPRVTYTAYRKQDQRLADIATSAFLQAYEDGGWQQRIRNAILISRIQKKAFLRLTYDPYAQGGSGAACLRVVAGEQVFADRNATCVDDAELLMYEYRESYGTIIARYPKVAKDLRRKRSDNRGYDKENGEGSGEYQTPPTQLAMPSGAIVNNPPYAGSPNPPDTATGTSGLIVREFWTRPKKRLKVEEILFTASGEPAVQEKTITYTDGETEPMLRVVTEGLVVYELPKSVVDMLRGIEGMGIHILDEMPAVEVIMHKVEYPCYPDGRLVVIVDDDIQADDRMNPLGYFPFVEIDAYPDGTQFFGQSDIDIIADSYEYLIRLISMLLDSANLTANPVWRLPLSSEISDEDITNAPGAVQREDLTSLRYGKREPGPNMPSYVMSLVTYIDAKIQKLSGLNDLTAGKSSGKSQESTESLSIRQEAAGVRFRDAMHNVEWAMTKLGQQFLELMARFYSTPRLIRVKNDVGVEEPISLLGSHICGPLHVEAKPGSGIPSPTARLNMILNLLQAGAVDKPELWSLLQELGVINSATALERRIEREMRNPAEQWKLGAPPNGGSQAKKPKSKRQKSALSV